MDVGFHGYVDLKISVQNRNAWKASSNRSRYL